jgi:DNA-binding CsgD family transcriptional regulator
MGRSKPNPDDLTPRELEVLALIREGLTNEQIAERLGVSFGTAKYHVAEILSKLSVSSREEAARWSGVRRQLGFAIPVLGMPNAGSILFRKGLLVLAGSLALVAAAAGLLLLLVAGIGSHSSVEPGEGLGLSDAAAVGLDVGPEGVRAFEQARMQTVYKHTVLLAKTAPVNLGSEAALITSLPRVQSLAELRAVLTPEINLIVVDRSSSDDLEGTAFLYEQWQAGRGIMGLNVCVADLPDSERTRNPGDGVVKEISPDGEVRYYDTTGLPDPGSRCTWALNIAEAGYAYVSYVPRLPTLEEIEALRDRGEPLIFNGGSTGRLDLPDGAACFVRDLLAYLDAGGYRQFFPEDCD